LLTLAIFAKVANTAVSTALAGAAFIAGQVLLLALAAGSVHSLALATIEGFCRK